MFFHPATSMSTGTRVDHQRLTTWHVSGSGDTLNVTVTEEIDVSGDQFQALRVPGSLRASVTSTVWFGLEGGVDAVHLYSAFWMTTVASGKSLTFSIWSP